MHVALDCDGMLVLLLRTLEASTAMNAVDPSREMNSSSHLGKESTFPKTA
jgi:hypothetical protein